MYMCPHTTVCPQTTVYMSSYYYICILRLLYMCPNTNVFVSSLNYICVLMHVNAWILREVGEADWVQYFGKIAGKHLLMMLSLVSRDPALGQGEGN